MVPVVPSLHGAGSPAALPFKAVQCEHNIAFIAENGRGLDQQCSNSAAGADEACFVSTSGELAAASQPLPAHAGRQPSASLSESSGSSWNTAAEALSRAPSTALADVEAAADAGDSQQKQDCQLQQPTSLEQPGSEGTTAAPSAADGHTTAQPPEASADRPLTLRQRFSFGFSRPPPPPPPPGDAALQNV